MADTKQSPQDKALADLHKGLTEARDHVIEVLNEHNFSMLAITAQTKFDQIINMIGHTLGQDTTSKPAGLVDLPPVTNFMGEELVKKEAVTEEILSPKEYAKKQFQQDVNDLEASFLEREDENILEAHSIPEHQIVLRGVAKRAGLEDFRTGKIDLNFVQRIRIALKDKADKAAKQKAAEEELA